MGARRIPRKLFRIAFRAGLVLALLLIVSAGVGAAVLRYAFQEPAYPVASRLARPELEWQRGKYPSVRIFFDAAMALLAEDRRNRFAVKTDDPDNGNGSPGNPFIGAGIADHLPPIRFDGSGVPLPTPLQSITGSASLAWLPSPSARNVVRVSTTDELKRAVAAAEPGTYILLAPGNYRLGGRSLILNRDGRANAPIFIGAASLGTVHLEFNMLEGFHILAPYWIIENLEITGTCKNHSYCEHAFHIVGRADGVVVRNNRVVDFNAPVKINGYASRGEFPDDGLIEYNSFYNRTPRNTGNPVTMIDVVAASNWRVNGNFVADFAKNGSDYTSYAGFFKGGGSGNVFERNLVMCEWRHAGGIRLGLSLGGGGTGAGVRREEGLADEDTGSIIRNNIIMACPADIGIYLNRAAGALIANNAILGTRGIDVRFPESSAIIVNNIIDGRIMARDGGSYEAASNILSVWKALTLGTVGNNVFAHPSRGDFRLVDPDAVLAKGKSGNLAGRDMCDHPHITGVPDIGPFSYRDPEACLPIIETTVAKRADK